MHSIRAAQKSQRLPKCKSSSFGCIKLPMRRDSGLYQLLILLPKTKTIRVGRLGDFSFPSGHYVYTGSAKRNLNARIERHLRSRNKTLHWHIDYFLEHGKISKVKRFEERGALSECGLNQKLLSRRDAQVIARGLGSSDCRCPTHLVYFTNSFLRR